MSDPSPDESDEQRVMRGIAERIDATGDSPDRFVGLARDMLTLLTESNTTCVVLLFEVISERKRITEVLGKYFERVITRTALLSFISEQRWSDYTRMKIAKLSDANLSVFASALHRLDVRQLCSLLE